MKDKELNRNRPSDEGRNNDPEVREESGQQPGVSTYSSSDTDESNQKLTKTASDGFRPENFGQGAEASFDEVGKDDK